MPSTLSPAQIKEAIELASGDLINQLESDRWSVTSLNNENSYTVKVADSVHAYDLWCTCSAWKFKKGAKDCKHCEAVRVLNQQSQSKSSQVSGRLMRTGLKGKRKTITKSKIPKDMTQTEKWYKTLSYSEVETLSTVIGLDLYEEWNENEHHVQWKIHEYYQKNEKNEKKSTLKSTLRKAKSKSNVKVTCWHCGNKDQKILSFEETFDCDKCKEPLWIGSGGYVEKMGGIYQ